MNEREGSLVLKRIFEAAGCSIVEAHPLALDGRTVSLDGFDPVRKIGFELVTTEAGDRAEFGPEVVEALERRMERGELYVFLVDEAQVEDAQALERSAGRFLAHLREKGLLP